MRIVMVDDDTHLCELMEFAFSARPDVDFAWRTSARDAQSELVADPPDVLISDVMMPEMSGPELVAALREAIPRDNWPITIFLTGKTNADAREELAEISDLIWYKPLDLRVAMTDLDKLMESASR